MSNGKFHAIAEKIANTVAKKNAAYGDSTTKCGEFLELLYPNGVQPEQYADMLGVVRVFDKLMRIANDKDAFGEDPWEDIAGYGIIGVERGTRKADHPGPLNEPRLHATIIGGTR
ncbi:hypothetical protein [Oryzomonas rubra]|uniref:Uncharacterized protein n=1 Tax=Oryzomonas rubra TaxID=2509454 RepID=A0A5A9X6A6_9BACT|nr:hypothetical protein [Oryzomonas rubra]KAA0888702.1 hypothetical protein ET418_15085 [Oryzomonas rubra]